MQDRIAVSAYCHALILGFPAWRAREFADRVFVELHPQVDPEERRSILDHAIKAVDTRGAAH